MTAFGHIVIDISVSALNRCIHGYSYMRYVCSIVLGSVLRRGGIGNRVLGLLSFAATYCFCDRGGLVITSRYVMIAPTYST